MNGGGGVWRSRLANLERTRRIGIVAAIAVIVVAGLSPLVSHHLLPGGEPAVERGRFIALCVVALRAVMAPLHELFHVLFWSGLAYAVWDRVRAGRLGRRELSLLTVSEARFEDPLWWAAQTAGIDPARVRAVSGLPGVALTIGWWTPLIYVSHETLARLDHDQLVAVLTHEGAHLHRRDPLRISVLRFLSCLFFWLPALRQLADDLADEIEIIADDAAAARQPLVLASALVQVAKFEGRPLPPIAVGFHGRPLFDRRIRRLIGEAPPPRSHLTRRAAAGGALALLLVMTSGLVVAQGSPASSMSHHAGHCERHEMPVLGHLLFLFDRADWLADARLRQANPSSLSRWEPVTRPIEDDPRAGAEVQPSALLDGAGIGVTHTPPDGVCFRFSPPCMTNWSRPRVLA